MSEQMTPAEIDALLAMADKDIELLPEGAHVRRTIKRLARALREQREEAQRLRRLYDAAVVLGKPDQEDLDFVKYPALSRFWDIFDELAGREARS